MNTVTGRILSSSAAATFTLAGALPDSVIILLSFLSHNDRSLKSLSHRRYVAELRGSESLHRILWPHEQLRPKG